MSRVRRRRVPEFDTRSHEVPLAAILERVAAAPRLDARALDRIVRRHPRDGCALFSKSQLIAGYRELGGAARFGIAETALLERLRLRPVRTLSGVTPVTVLTKPYPCPGRCVFCPSDVRMPKSYLRDEPGAQRAEANRFDPYLQVWNRLAAYRAIGHPTAKVELIVLGGTWSHYPEAYQRWFAARCLTALNDFGAGVDGRAGAGAAPPPAAATGEGAYNQRVGRALARANDGALLHASETASWAELTEAQRKNERAGARCVGFSVETRPDAVDADEALRLRRLGVTKLQLGIQSSSDAILAANRRGHDTAATRRALALLRRHGFKLQGHWMANLLGATPESDAEDFARLWSDPGLRPDELKLYPCVLIESAELAGHHARGEWQPYDDETLLGLVSACLASTPAWCRVTRVIRDFSAGDIAAGSRVANLREPAEQRLRAAGTPPVEIRSREVRAAAPAIDSLRLVERRYASAVGEERFLEFATAAGALAGFLRLGLPSTPAPLRELEGRALVREVHVYGASLELGRRGAHAQHAGLGRRLVERAAVIARAEGYAGLAVISAVGTREYYRGLGFSDGALYQHRTWTDDERGSRP